MIRTCDPQIRNLVLYPTELRAQININVTYDLINYNLDLFIMIY